MYVFRLSLPFMDWQLFAMDGTDWLPSLTDTKPWPTRMAISAHTPAVTANGISRDKMAVDPRPAQTIHL